MASGEKSGEGLLVRRGRPEDLGALRDIYNYEVEHGVATLDLTPRSFEDRAAWFEAHQSDLHPLYVAEICGVLAGYATLSPYRAKEAYRPTVELSVYVGPDHRGRGVASVLMRALLAHARAYPDIHLVVSVITSGNAASVHLHEKFGFSYAGTLHQVGLKNNVYQDICMYELLV